MIRLFSIATLCVLASALHAGLIESQCGGKAEDAVVKDFENGLCKMLEPRIADQSAIRLTVTVKKDSYYCQLIAIEEGQLVFASLEKAGVDSNSGKTIWGAMGPKHKLKPGELSPAGVASWFDVPRCKVDIVVSLAAWLVSKKQPMLANEKLAQLSKINAALKVEIEDWLCVKLGWTKPATGLTLTETHDLETAADSVLLLTPDAATARLAELDKTAKQALKELVIARGDTKGSYGTRKKLPTLPLSVLRDQYSRFDKAFKGTPTADASRIKMEIAAALESLDSDLKVITENKLRAERSALDEKFKEAGDMYELLLRGDPANIDLIMLTANSYWRASVLKDSGNKCENPDMLKKALTYYEELLRRMPRMLSALNYLGTCHQGLGNKDKAKAYYNEVLKLGDPEKDKANREFATKNLANLK
jgi:tetratricopeptide (TPR) repeat protein